MKALFLTTLGVEAHQVLLDEGSFLRSLNHVEPSLPQTDHISQSRNKIGACPEYQESQVRLDSVSQMHFRMPERGRVEICLPPRPKAIRPVVISARHVLIVI